MCGASHSGLHGINDEDLINLIKSQWQAFNASHGHYPSAQEIDASPDMVTTRTIQRRFGGLKNLRQTLGHEESNYSSGPRRSAIALMCMNRSMNEEDELLVWLIERFGKKPNVISEDRYHEFDTRNRSDFGVYHQEGNFFIDVFSAQDKHSLSACLNQKQKKIEKSKTKEIVYLVSTNKNITQVQIDTLVKNKKNPLPENVIALTLDGFKVECDKYNSNVL